MGDGVAVTAAGVLEEARGRVRMESVQFVVLAVVAGVAGAAAVSGRFADVPGPLWWVLAGAAGMDAVNAAVRLVAAARFVARARRDVTFLALSVLYVDAQLRRAQWLRTGVVVGPVEPPSTRPSGAPGWLNELGE